MFHPTRGGTRGGRDQFSWDDVKNSKHREYYLGHSVKASLPRPGQMRNPPGGESSVEANNVGQIKSLEADLMAEALGLKPRQKDRNQDVISKHELSRLLELHGPEAAAAEEGDKLASAQLGAVERRLGLNTGGRITKETLAPEYQTSSDDEPKRPSAAKLKDESTSQPRSEDRKQGKESRKKHSKSDKKHKKRSRHRKDSENERNFRRYHDRGEDARREQTDRGDKERYQYRERERSPIRRRHRKRSHSR